MAVVTDTITVGIVDDDPLVRAGLRMILGGSKDLVVVAEAGDGEEAVALVREHCPDVILMDVRMPRCDGIEATRRIVEWQRREALRRDGMGRDTPAGLTRVLVLTTFDTDELVLEALREGAAGFLLKDTPPERLVTAVRAVAAGEPTLSPSVTAQLIARVSGAGEDDRTGRARSLLDELSEREREVAVLIGRGLSNADIASELFLSVPTVKTYVGRLFDRLGVENRVQIALLAHDAGLD